MSQSIRILECKPLPGPATFAAVDVAHPSGMIIKGVLILARKYGEGVYALPPGKAQLAGLSAIEDPRKPGKPKYTNFIDFTDKQTRERWSDAVVAAVRDQHPEVLSGEQPR